MLVSRAPCAMRAADCISRKALSLDVKEGVAAVVGMALTRLVSSLILVA